MELTSIAPVIIMLMKLTSPKVMATPQELSIQYVANMNMREARMAAITSPTRQGTTHDDMP